jgi:hypothetical protein
LILNAKLRISGRKTKFLHSFYILIGVQAASPESLSFSERKNSKLVSLGFQELRRSQSYGLFPNSPNKNGGRLAVKRRLPPFTQIFLNKLLSLALTSSSVP